MMHIRVADEVFDVRNLDTLVTIYRQTANGIENPESCQ